MLSAILPVSLISVALAQPAPPQSLSADEIYGLCAFILALNRIVAPDAVMDAHSLPKVRMPNRSGFTGPDPRPDVGPRAPR